MEPRDFHCSTWWVLVGATGESPPWQGPIDDAPGDCVRRGWQGPARGTEATTVHGSAGKPTSPKALEFGAPPGRGTRVDSRIPRPAARWVGWP